MPSLAYDQGFIAKFFESSGCCDVMEASDYCTTSEKAALAAMQVTVAASGSLTKREISKIGLFVTKYLNRAS